MPQNVRRLAYLPQKERDKLKSSDFALPKQRKYYIRNQQDVYDAASLAGKSKDASYATVRRRIIAIANRKGFQLPKEWQDKEESEPSFRQQALQRAQLNRKPR